MAVSLQQARVLCTKAELILFEASRPPLLKAHNLTRLQAKIKRARTLRDKYRDLYKRQRLAVRAKTGSKKPDNKALNQRTQAKALLFAEVLTRLQQQEALLKAAAKKAAQKAKAATKLKSLAKRKLAAKAKTQRAPKAKSKVKPKAKAKAGFRAAKAAHADERQRGQKTRSKAVMGHTRAAGKRRQAKRDARR